MNSNFPPPAKFQRDLPVKLRDAISIFLLLLGILFAAGCSRTKETPPSAQPANPTVGVIVMTPTSVTLTRELPGRISPFRIAEVRARVSGIVRQRRFTEGAVVKAGDILFEIDAAPYRAAVASAKATLARAEANVASARAQAERYQTLVSTSAISKQEYDNANATLLANQADVASGQAAVETAEIDLGYTQVTAPVSGRIGRSAVTEGAFVQQSQATLLATVQQLDPIYVDLTQSSNELAALKNNLASGILKPTADGSADVSLLLDGNVLYARPGKLQFADVTVDQSTGSVSLRALFPNSNGDLLPGMFVRAKVSEGINPAALLLPQLGVSRTQQGGSLVMVVNAENKAEPRPVTTGRAIGDKWLITAGLNPGDRVIVEGLQQLRPGTLVNAVPAGEKRPAPPAGGPPSSPSLAHAAR